MSTKLTSASLTEPGSIFPGQRAMNGWLIPPSCRLHFSSGQSDPWSVV